MKAKAAVLGEERAKDDDAFGICRSDSDKNARANLIIKTDGGLFVCLFACLLLVVS